MFIHFSKSLYSPVHQSIARDSREIISLSPYTELLDRNKWKKKNREIVILVKWYFALLFSHFMEIYSPFMNMEIRFQLRAFEQTVDVLRKSFDLNWKFFNLFVDPIVAFPCFSFYMLLSFRSLILNSILMMMETLTIFGVKSSFICSRVDPIFISQSKSWKNWSGSQEFV